jgi:hypothetical protein
MKHASCDSFPFTAHIQMFHLGRLDIFPANC